MGELILPTHLVVLLVLFGIVSPILADPLVVVPCWQIFKKAGFPAPLSLLLWVPIAGLVMLYVVAFSRWKTDPNAALYPGAAQQQPQYPSAG
ncbi:MAG TPA: hypothetical protein VNW54_16685 [Granulicella sp.]|nr:hypothetical protein [Granulicella sp.]